MYYLLRQGFGGEREGCRGFGGLVNRGYLSLGVQFGGFRFYVVYIFWDINEGCGIVFNFCRGFWVRSLFRWQVLFEELVVLVQILGRIFGGSRQVFRRVGRRKYCFFFKERGFYFFSFVRIDSLGQKRKTVYNDFRRDGVLKLLCQFRFFKKEMLR